MSEKFFDEMRIVTQNKTEFAIKFDDKYFGIRDYYAARMGGYEI